MAGPCPPSFRKSASGNCAGMHLVTAEQGWCSSVKSAGTLHRNTVASTRTPRPHPMRASTSQRPRRCGGVAAATSVGGTVGETIACEAVVTALLLLCPRPHEDAPRPLTAYQTTVTAALRQRYAVRNGPAAKAPAVRVHLRKSGWVTA